MSDKKAFPHGQQPAQTYLPTAPQYAAQYAQLYQQQQVASQQVGGAQLYPAAPPSYEQAIAHPSLSASAQAQQHPSSAWVYAGGQPMYANYQAAAVAAAAAQNYQQLQAAGYAAYAPAYFPMNYQAYAAAAAQQQQQQQQQQRQTIMMSAAYDGGARFDGVSQPAVAPAPPGVAPNAAQIAAMAGHTVVLGQKKGNYLTGSSDGGYTFW